MFFSIGEARFITVTRVEGKGRGDRAELPPMLCLGQARDTALDAYFTQRPPGEREVDAVMSAAAGGGMHAAAELATQKKHKARQREFVLKGKGRGGQEG